MADQTKNILVQVEVDASKAEAGTSKARAALASVGEGFASARQKGNELADELEVVGIVAGIVPAWRASRIRIVDGLRHVA